MTQYKITQHTESQENLKQSSDIKNKMTQMLEFSDKDFNTASLKMPQQGRISTLETNREMQCLSRKSEDFKNENIK